MSELDLEKGDPLRAERIEPSTPKASSSAAGTVKKSSQLTGKRKSGPTMNQRIDGELKERLNRLFNRLADLREAQGDQELADALRDTIGEMTQGFVSLTRNVTFLRTPLLLGLGLLEPVIAFWQVGRILVGRWYARRVMSVEEAQRIHEENERFAAEHPAQTVT